MKHSNQKVCAVCKSEAVSLWCKTKDLEYFTSKETYTYYQCNTCSSIFIDTFPTDQLQNIYPSNYYSFHEQKKSIALKVKTYLDKRLFKKLLNRFHEKSINVLDVGGGSGWLLNSIKAIYPNVNITQVIDIDLNAKTTAERHGHRFFHGTVEAYESDTTFDLILMLNLVEHISNPKGTLEKLSQMLNKDGTILIKTPNTESWDAKLFKNTYWGGLHCPRHWVLFSKSSFELLISQTSLSIAKFQYTQGAPFWTWSIIAKLYRMGITTISKERPMINHPLVPFLNITFAAFDFFRQRLGFKTSQMFIQLEKTS